MSLQNPNVTPIMEALATHYGRRVVVVPLQDDLFKEDVADATRKFLVPTPEGGEGFLQLSGSGNPQLVDRAARNIATARTQVSKATARPVLAPVMTGQIAGMDFAIWPYKRPFETSNRLLRRIRYRLYAGRIVGWARTLCRETIQDADPQTVARDLREICEDAGLPAEMRRAAEQAVTRLNSGQWRPVHCLHHGDFWPANLLLAARGEGTPFYVIDWAGMQQQGYPFLDLVQMLMSLRCGQGFARRSLARLRQDIGCTSEEMQAYILSAYGHIGQNLEHFPRDRYQAAAQSAYHFVKQF